MEDGQAGGLDLRWLRAAAPLGLDARLGKETVPRKGERGRPRPGHGS